MERLRRFAFVCLFLSGLFCTSLFAQTVEVQIYVDNDGPAAGCDIVLPALTTLIPGAESRLTAAVNTQTAQVDTVVAAQCTGAGFGPDQLIGGGYPVALNAGLGGADAVEMAALVADLGINVQGAQIYVVGNNPNTGSQDLLGAVQVARPPGGSAIPIPTAGTTALLLLGGLLLLAGLVYIRRHRVLLGLSLLTLAGIVWAAHFAADGDLSDWAGQTPAATDPLADPVAPDSSIDLAALFVAFEINQVFFRVDVGDIENAAPVADAVVANTTEDTPVTITLTGSDADSDPLTFAIDTPPANGTLGPVIPVDATSATVDYTPNADFNGADAFTYLANDGTADSAPATVDISVGPVNDPPTANDDTFMVDEDSAANLLDLLANDSFAPDTGETLSITAVGATDNGGTVVNNGTDVSYNPAPDFFGTETFTYDIDDGNGGTDTATVTVTVNNVNDDPTAADDAFTVDPDSSNNLLDVLANDSFAPDTGETLTVSGVGATDNGGTVINNGTDLSYSPAVGFFGVETFSYDIDDGNGGSASATVTVTVIQPEADLSVTKTDSPDPVLAGETLTYTVTVNNAGPHDAQNVVVTDTLPVGVTFVSTSGCTEDPNGVPSCSLGTIANGASAQYTIEVTVDATTSGLITNNASVTSDTVDPDAVNNSVTEDTAVTPLEADLSITKVDSVDPVLAGDNLIYTITVNNAGPHDAQNVVVTDMLNTSVNFVATAGCAEDPTGVDTCSLGTIPAGGSTAFTIEVTVNPFFMGTTMNDNTATVTSDTSDPDAGNNSATEPTVINAPAADLAVTKTDSVDPVVQGEMLTYTIVVDNLGPQDAENVIATEFLPGGVTLVSTSGCAEDPGGAPTCSLGTIPAAGSAMYTVTVMVDLATSGLINNQVGATSDIWDPDSVNNTLISEDTTVLVREADLSVSKADSMDPVTAGDPLTYTVTVTNAGPQEAENVVVTDTLPAGVNFVSTTGCAEDPAGVPTCSLGNLAIGAMTSYTIQVIVDAATPSGVITNLASVASDIMDPNTGNDAMEDTTVQGLNSAPILDPVGNQMVDELTALNFTATASDGEAPPQILTFSLSGEPAGAGITAGGLFSWTPTEAQGPGMFTFDVIVSDDGTPNLMDSETITVTVNEVNLPPTAAPDGFAATGNVGIDVPFASGLIVNDGDTDLPPQPLNITAETVASINGGSATIAADGSFIYTPPAGFTGMDTFSYTLNDNFGGMATGTVTVTVADMIWFIDNSVAGPGTGTLPDPFSALTTYEGSALPAAGDCIFIEETASGAYTGPLTLDNSQILLGNGFVGAIDSGCGITLPANSVMLPTAGGAAPLITSAGDGIVLGTNNTVRGLDIGNTTGTGLTGFNFGTLTIDDITINGTGRILNLDTGTVTDPTGGDFTFGSLATTANGVFGIDLNAVTGGFTVDTTTTISGGTQAMDIDGSSGTFDFGATTIDGGADTGIDIASSGGSTFTFDSLEITTDSGFGLSTSNGGTINIAGTTNTITTTGGPGIALFSTTIGAGGFTFDAISVNGGTSGIVLNGTGSNGITVTGDGSTLTQGGNDSGGVIQNTSGDGVVLNSANSITLQNMTIGDPAVGTADADYAAANVVGDGIDITTVTGLILNNVTIARTGGHGVNANGLTNLMLADSLILNAGNGDEEHGLNLDELRGDNFVTNSLFDGFNETGIELINASGSVDLTVDNTTFQDNKATAGNFGEEAILIIAQGTASIVVLVTGDANLGTSDSIFDDLESQGVQAISEGTSSDIQLTVENSRFLESNSGDAIIIMNPDNAGSGNLTVDNCTFTDDTLGPFAVLAKNDSTSTLDATIQNSITTNMQLLMVNHDNIGSGGAANGTSRILADNNTANVGSNNIAVDVIATETPSTGAGPDLSLTLTNNTSTQPDNIFTFTAGLRIDAQQTSRLNADISGNSFQGDPSTSGGSGIEARELDTAVLGLEGFAGGTTAAAQTFIDSANPGSQDVSFVTSTVDGNISAGAATAPTATTLPNP